MSEYTHRYEHWKVVVLERTWQPPLSQATSSITAIANSLFFSFSLTHTLSLFPLLSFFLSYYLFAKSSFDKSSFLLL